MKQKFFANGQKHLRSLRSFMVQPSRRKRIYNVYSNSIDFNRKANLHNSYAGTNIPLLQLVVSIFFVDFIQFHAPSQHLFLDLYLRRCFSYISIVELLYVNVM